MAMLKYSVIPKPVRYDAKETTVEISTKTAVLCSEEFVSVGQFLTSYLKTNPEEGSNAIRIKKVNGIAEEGYALYTENGDVYIKASTEKGAFYAAVTLKWILLQSPKSGGKATVSGFFIEDKPKYSHRGILLDVSRHFYGVDTVKRLLDNMSMLKMNVFHWHLCDDQGYRIESKAFPLLNEIGSVRERDSLKIINSSDEEKPYGPYFYTFDEIKSVVEYAKSLHIAVIPEIDIPGHSSEFVASYPELGCVDEKVTTASTYGVKPNLLNPAKENTYEFLSALFDEVCPLFPDNRFHIGSDEAVYGQWKNNEEIQAFMKEQGISDEKHLQIYFINRVNKLLASKGKQTLAWSDCVEDEVDKDVVCQLWRITDKAKIIRQPFPRQTIVSLTNHFYFDYRHTALPIGKVYTFNEKALKLQGDKINVKGIECTLWTENITTDAALECGIYPRISALAEVGWTSLDNRNYTDFKRRLKFYKLMLESRNINYYRPKNPPFGWWLGNIYSMGENGKDYKRNEKKKEKGR
ncbi:MAG: beta-N-acetylhexosaminidase [Clostridia bacterium]|nr:beta-N-acetylhexosaminidase [Clostridia bacterium]